MKEGKIYVLSNFKVKDYVGDETYRPVRNKKHIYFTTYTRLKKDIGVGLRIEQHAFDLFWLGEIVNLAKDNRFLIGKFIRRIFVCHFNAWSKIFLAHRCCWTGSKCSCEH